MNQFEEKTIKSETVFNGRIIDVQVDDVMLPNGKTSKREIVKHPGAVAIIPVSKNNKIIFVKQYRKPLEKVLVEIPAGKLEEGESPEITALRELEEETGFTTKNMNYVSSFYTSPGFADEIIYLYETNSLEKLTELKELDEDEFVELIELSIDEAEKLIATQEIHDIKTIYAILYLKSKGMK
ncbi:ADP-ribose pyrophosphatase [Gracilibacillus boraciitolerans JCM 21714]|uniref:ADP-ribose pyrophosphatase n=1 Tax=Gracilibacillus boraciitolerans JCM 21714 TaxID=1298598 RepID=W4VEQ4_9BACI|nr:NUDIX hydrolase [Gracilibacillus boraciitolerans]GAE91293.1 ADP-ribose pyrophosphatase [Gracilibacillus boraciitolerans JCM 21714]